jgi:hypothetical protein
MREGIPGSQLGSEPCGGHRRTGLIVPILGIPALFCLLERDGGKVGLGGWLGGPSLVLITGKDKPFRTVLSARDYAEVRRLGSEYLGVRLLVQLARRVHPGAGVGLRSVVRCRYRLRRRRRGALELDLDLCLPHGGHQQERQRAVQRALLAGDRRLPPGAVQLSLPVRRDLPRRHLPGGLLRASYGRYAPCLRGCRRTVRVFGEHHLQRNGAAGCVCLLG